MNTIEISESTFNEIADELIRTGHEDAVILEKDRSVSLNMHGICIMRKAANVVNLPKKKMGADDIRNYKYGILQGFE